MTNHTELLNYLAEKYNLQSYLEIGVQNPANNFDKIGCLVKHGIDPNLPFSQKISGQTSDEYFKWHFEDNPDFKYDLIFIDGLHHSDQVKRDFENSLCCLNDGGFIVIHDTLPENEEGTIVPRQTKVWWGDVYKFVMVLNEYDGIRYVTLNIDNGCTVIWKDENRKGGVKNDTINWASYCYFREASLKIIQPSEIEHYF